MNNNITITGYKGENTPNGWRLKVTYAYGITAAPYKLKRKYMSHKPA